MDLQGLKEQMRLELTAAKAIKSKYDTVGKDIPDDELAVANGHMKSFDNLKREHEALEVKQQFADAGIDLGLEGDVRPKAHTLGQNSKQRSANAWGAAVESKLRSRLGNFGAKALIGGTIDIPSVITPEPVLIDGRPTTLLDLIPRRPRTNNADPFLAKATGNTFEWVVQTTRALNASSVPDDAQKPVSGITFEGREDRFRVYATLTDPIPKRFLDDYRQLIDILKDQLGEGLFEALEFDILNGSGTPTAEVKNGSGVVTTFGKDPVKGILQTSGILVQPYTSNVLTTLSNARYSLEDTRIKPNAWVMNSRDLQALELMREDGATGPLLFGSGRSDIERILGSYPIVTSSLITQGSALLGDFTKTELIIREDDHLDVDGSGELFKRNEVIFREEGRYGFEVNKPSAFISVDLTA